MAGPTHVGSNGIFEMKTRPPSLALPAPPNPQKGLSGMLFFRGILMERRLWHTANTLHIFFPLHLHVWRNHRYKHGIFTPQSQAVEMESVHAVPEGWGDDQLQHERHLVYQCYLQKHRSTLRGGSREDSLSPEWCFWQRYLIRYYSNLGVQIQLGHIAVYSSQAACSSRQNWEYSQWDSPESTFIS